MPLGSYNTWDECVNAQIKKGHNKEAAKRICGHIESQMKKAHEAKE